MNVIGKIRGIMPALITPVNPDLSLRKSAVAPLVNWQLEQGVNGFYIGGYTGEGPILPEHTRMRMVESVLETTKGRAINIAHVAAYDIQSALRMAKHAQACGCDAISSIPPLYMNYSEDECFDYYQRLGEASDLPLFVYANDMFKQKDITPLFKRLMTLPTIAGLKFTRYNFYEMRNLIEIEGTTVINGPDEMLICGLSVGAHGGIGSTYNLIPRSFVELFQAYETGNMETARKLQFGINHVIRVLYESGMIRSIKQALCLRGFDVGAAVFPSKPFSSKESSGLWSKLSVLPEFQRTL